MFVYSLENAPGIPFLTFELLIIQVYSLCQETEVKKFSGTN